MIDDRDEHLAGHVAAHDQDFAVVEACGVQEFPKAAIGGMDVGHEEGAVISHRRSPRAARTRAPADPRPPAPSIPATLVRPRGLAGLSRRAPKYRGPRP